MANLDLFIFICIVSSLDLLVAIMFGENFANIFETSELFSLEGNDLSEHPTRLLNCARKNTGKSLFYCAAITGSAKSSYDGHMYQSPKSIFRATEKQCCTK